MAKVQGLEPIIDIPDTSSQHSLQQNGSNHVEDSGEEPLLTHVHADDEVGGESNKKAAVYNLLCTVMGGGILSLPYAMSQSGIALGVCLFALISLYNAYTLELLFTCGRLAAGKFEARKYGDGNIFEGDDKLNGEYNFYKHDNAGSPVYTRQYSASGKEKDEKQVFMKYSSGYSSPRVKNADEWHIYGEDPTTEEQKPSPLARVRTATIPKSTKTDSPKAKKIEITSHARRIVSYGQVGQFAYGKYGRIAAVLTLGVLSYFVIIVYFMFLSGVIPDVIRFTRGMDDGEEDFWVSPTFAMIVTLVIAFPLAAQRKIDNLKYPSMIAVGCLGFVVLTIIIEGASYLVSGEERPNGAGDPVLAYGGFEIVRTLAVATSANIVHVNGLTQFTELQDIRKTKVVSSVTMTITATFYIAVGIFGYLNFTDQTEDNILVNYDSSNVLAFVARLCIIWKLLISIALISFATRRSIVSYFWANRNIRPLHEFFLTCGLLFSTYGLANLLGDVVGLMLALLGGSLGALLALIYPTMFYIRLKSGKVIDFKDSDHRLPSVVFLISIVFACICTAVSLIDFVEAYS